MAAPPVQKALHHRTPRRSLPAWVLSVALHLLVLLLLGLFVRQADRRGLREEPSRSVDIVLARSLDEAEYAYFDQPLTSSQPATSPNAEASSAPAKSPRGPLPRPGEAPLLPDIELPDSSPLLGVAASSLVDGPRLNGSAPRRPFLPASGDEQAFVEAERAARQAGRPSGPPARLSVFGSAAAVGHSFVFVIDRSYSMGSDGLGVLPAAQQELDQALRRLGPNHQFQIVAYNQQTAHLGERRLKAVTAENLQAASRFVGDLVAFGKTEHQTALMSALFQKPDVIFLLTDGGYPDLTQGQLDLIRRVAGRRTTIHCLRFGWGAEQEEEHFMRRLASQNGGTYHYVDMSKRRAPGE